MSMTTTGATNADVINVLRASLYPGAKTESIELVLAYCRINGLDPMLKPVHIVPTSVKTASGGYEMRDVLMPGIADYRIKAARSGEYLGKSEPLYGPVMEGDMGGVRFSYPEWCKITIRRLVAGKEAEFTATEYWVENYATQKRDSTAPNAMWKKRAFGQLAKCTEAQVLRMAFPEFSGGQVTAEEMEGKVFEGAAEVVRNPPPRAAVTLQSEAPKAPPTPEEWARDLVATFDAADTYEKVQALVGDFDIAENLERAEKARPELYKLVDAAKQRAMDRIVPPTVTHTDEEMPA